MTFDFDPREIPDSIKTNAAQRKFVDEVDDKLKRSGTSLSKDAPLFGAIVGMLVLEDATDPTSPTFDSTFWDVRGETDGRTINAKGRERQQEGTFDPDDDTNYTDNKDVYTKVAQVLAGLPGHKQSTVPVIYYQELADVSRKLIANADNVPFGDPTFTSQIRVYDDEYVANGPQAAGGLEIPDLTGSASAASPDDIRAPNIQSVAVIAAAYNLEQARVFDAVDRIMETWWNGQLPVGFGRGSKALDDLYWTSELRLSPTARHMQYGRVVGAPGGEVSTEVQPNTQFNDLFMRFVANLAEYDRQQRLGDIVGQQHRNALALTAEQVRQSGRNLAANTSLYGWGGTQFAARRIAGHIKKAFEVLNTPDIQAAYGVSGPWKVVERVSQELGAVPNLVKWRTMAAATKNILDLVAKYSDKWSGSTGKPLFNDPASSAVAIGDGFESVGNEVRYLTDVIKAQFGGQNLPAAPVALAMSINPGGTADISDADRDELIRQSGNYIAVLGIKDDAVEQLSEPTEAQLAPSIPSLTVPSTNGGGAGLDQLKQMVAQGQVPSLDQLKGFVMPSAG
jgi:hypothetical protein